MIARRRPAGIRAVDVIVVGAGHAGLAVSRCLTERGIEHLVLERGEVANAWRHERWDSLRLLTPNWQSRLPGYRYGGAEPRWIHDDAGGGRIHRPLCAHISDARSKPHQRDFRPRRRGRLSSRHRPRRVVVRGRRVGERRLQLAGDSGVAARVAGVGRVGGAARVSQSRANSNPAACWWSGHRRAECSWPMKSSVRGVTYGSRSASTFVCRARIAAATSSAGWKCSACSTSATTRSTTSSGRAACRRRNSSARRKGPTSI